MWVFALGGIIILFGSAVAHRLKSNRPEDLPAENILCCRPNLNSNLLKRSRDKGGSDQKRQKILDWAEEDIYNFKLEYQRSEAFVRTDDDLLFLWVGNINSYFKYLTPGYISRCITQAYGFTSLEYGQQLRGFSYHAAVTYKRRLTEIIEETNVCKFKFRVEDKFVVEDHKFVLDPTWLGEANSKPEFERNRGLESIWNSVRILSWDVSILHIPNLCRHGFAKVPILRSIKNSASRKGKNLANMSGDSTLFDESFTITGIDDNKYDRVSRLAGTSGDSQTVMTLDINSELFNITTGENIHCVLASSLSLDGSKDDKGWRDVATGEPTLADMFDYVCHGKIYKFEDGEDGQTM